MQHQEISFQEVRSIPFFFIVGRPRSGTTLLRTLIDAHPNAICPPEYAILPYLYGRFPQFVTEWDDHYSKLFKETMSAPLAFDFWKYEYLGVNEDALSRLLDDIKGPVRFDEVYKAVYYCSTSLWPKEQIKVIGDKNPVYALNADRLLKFFPGAKFIHITRDYRDNFVSMRKFEFEAPNVVLQAFRWKYLTKKLFNLQEKYPDQFLWIRHEDLANDPEAILRKVDTFLGISYDETVLNFHEKKEELLKRGDSYDLILKYHESLTQPVNASGVGKWKKVLTDSEVRKADYIVGSLAEKCGYQRVYTKGSLGLWLSTLPMSLYGYLLYKSMELGDRLPYIFKKYFGKALPQLVKIYRFITGKGKNPVQVRSSNAG